MKVSYGVFLANDNIAMPFNEKLNHSLRAWLGASTTQLFWYALLASSVWLFFYVVFRVRFRHRRIGRVEPMVGQKRRELLHSLRSILIFGLMAALIVQAILTGWTRMYFRIEDYGWGYFAFSVTLIIVIHDAYFYWTHRLMHHRWLYRTFHHTHHLSTNPTPWAAYAFSPWEAFVQAGIAPLVFFTIPVHPAAFALFMVWQISFNVFGHCGYEIFPQWFLRSPLGKLLNSVTHHNLHHEKYRANFSLYFNVWDRLMGTNHADYQRRFELATEQPETNPRTTG